MVQFVLLLSCSCVIAIQLTHITQDGFTDNSAISQRQRSCSVKYEYVDQWYLWWAFKSHNKTKHNNL